MIEIGILLHNGNNTLFENIFGDKIENNRSYYNRRILYYLRSLLSIAYSNIYTSKTTKKDPNFGLQQF